MLSLLAMWFACGGPTEPTPTPSAPAPTEPFRPRTGKQREWDIAAGIDPDKPLPAWNMGKTIPAPPVVARACAKGVGGQLEVPDGPAVSLASPLPGDFVVPSGRHQGERALDVMALTGGAAATAVSCTGEELAIDASAPGRWLMVVTGQGWLKLIDLPTDPMRPALKDVTIIKRR